MDANTSANVRRTSPAPPLAWQQAYAELAQAPAGAGTTALRRRLIALSGTLCTHPRWATPTAWRTGGVELRRATHTSVSTEGEGAA